MSHRDEQYSIIEITCLMTDGNHIYHGEHFIVYINVESLCCTPETKKSAILKLKIICLFLKRLWL